MLWLVRSFVLIHLGRCALAEPSAVDGWPDVNEQIFTDPENLDAKVSENADDDKQILPVRFLQQPQPIGLSGPDEFLLDNGMTYLAANLMWSPYERVSVGIEYLHGYTRRHQRRYR